MHKGNITIFCTFVGMKNTHDKKRILFVCLGNICRSPAAEGVMRSIVDGAARRGEITPQEAENWIIDSAGTGRWHIGQLPDRRMRIHARQRGLELTHHCRQVERDDFDRFDLIIGMDSQNVVDLKNLAPSPEAEKKVVPMGQWLDPAQGYDYVPDPYYEGAEGFELVLDLLQRGCRNLFESIKNQH